VQLLLVCTVSRVTQQFNQFTACRKEEEGWQNSGKHRGTEANIPSISCQDLPDLLAITPAGEVYWKVLVLMAGNLFTSS